MKRKAAPAWPPGKRAEDWRDRLREVYSKEQGNEVAESRTSAPDRSEIDSIWQENEKSFHLEQAKLKSQIRIKNGRETQFDFLLQLLLLYTGEITEVNAGGKDITEYIKKPYKLVLEACLSEVSSICSAADVHLRLDFNEKSQLFWRSVKDLCKWQIMQKDIELDEESQKRIHEIVSSKPIEALRTLVGEITLQIETTPTNGYWGIMLAKTKSQLAVLSLEVLTATLPYFTIVNSHQPTGSSHLPEESPTNSPRCPQGLPALTQSELSSLYLTERKAKLSAMLTRTSPLCTNNAVLPLLPPTQPTPFSKSLKPNEELLTQTVNLQSVLEPWHNKYKPQKPKFFNRIKTGYEWTKHNQTHFDSASPPPKVVQGYKFNVFYPNLLDKSKAPQFYLEPDESIDTCTIRFRAGPPYEDIAFRIVNREWNFSERHGFKSFFENGILHLYFNFKRHRYKR